MDVVDAILEQLPDRPGLSTTWGQVTATAPLTVRLAGDTAGTPVGLRDAGYTPAVNDKVWLVAVGSKWLVAGKVVAA